MIVRVMPILGGVDVGVDATLQSWAELQSEFAGGVLLLGNGSSRAIWADFEYSSLYDQAQTEIEYPLEPKDEALFASLENNGETLRQDLISVESPERCRECGGVISNPERQYCRDCLPKFQDERTGKLVDAARRVLADMRGSPDDPARSPQAIAKRVVSNASWKEAALAWERMNPGPHDPEVFRREILPRIAGLTVPQLMRATGLTSSYCWRIRRGERVPHPIYWESLRVPVAEQP